MQGEKDLIKLWKASDVWAKMTRGFQNSMRFVVNAVGAIGIFLAVAAIPAGVLFLAIGLPIIIHKKNKRKKSGSAESAAGGLVRTGRNRQEKRIKNNSESGGWNWW